MNCDLKNGILRNPAEKWWVDKDFIKEFENRTTVVEAKHWFLNNILIWYIYIYINEWNNFN